MNKYLITIETIDHEGFSTDHYFQHISGRDISQVADLAIEIVNRRFPDAKLGDITVMDLTNTEYI